MLASSSQDPVSGGGELSAAREFHGLADNLKHKVSVGQTAAARWPHALPSLDRPFVVRSAWLGGGVLLGGDEKLAMRANFTSEATMMSISSLLQTMEVRLQAYSWITNGRENRPI